MDLLIKNPLRNPFLSRILSILELKNDFILSLFLVSFILLYSVFYHFIEKFSVVEFFIALKIIFQVNELRYYCLF